MRRILAALLFFGSGGCAAAPPDAWRSVDAQTGRISGIAELQQLAAEFPYSASVQLRLLNAAHQAGDAQLVRATMMRLAEMGYALSPGALTQLAPDLASADADALGARFEANRQGIEASTVFATVAAERRLIEGVAWDARTNRLFVTSVVGRELLVLQNDWTTVRAVEGGSLFGLAIDEPRRLLWIGSGSAEVTPSPQRAFRGLIALSLADGRVVRRVPAPAEGATPSTSSSPRTAPSMEATPPPGRSIGPGPAIRPCRSWCRPAGSAARRGWRSRPTEGGSMSPTIAMGSQPSISRPAPSPSSRRHGR